MYASGPLWAQAAPAASPEENEEIIVMSPFEVRTDAAEGYHAADTLAGNRLNTQLRDIGNAVTVITAKFLQDTGAVNNETLLQYTVGTEVGNVYGNFAGVGDAGLLDESPRFLQPNQNTRVRGLSEADNSRNYFASDIPWDGYNVDRVELQRGPNSILFGQGKPAGLINTGTKEASFKDSAQTEIGVASFGSFRATLDVNRVLIPNELALRFISVYDDEKFKQEPAFERDKRVYGALRFEPGFLKKGSARTILKASFEAGKINSNRPRSLPPIDRVTPWFLTGSSPGAYRYNASTGNWTSTNSYLNPNRGLYTPYQLQEETGIPNTGQQRRTVGGNANPFYTPYLGNFAQVFGGPLAFADGMVGGTPSYLLSESKTSRGINSAGQIDQNISIPFNRMGSITDTRNYALAAGLPFAQSGVWKDLHITDPSIFNFYDNLMDGSNKSEWQNFTSLNVSLAQLFLNDTAGFELNFNKEKYDNGILTILTGDRQAIFLDINSRYPNGSADNRFEDGTVNPNAGRPFISDSAQFGNNSTHSERESRRLTVFYKHDFERGGNSNTLTKILGNHTLTGLLSRDESDRATLSWQRWAILDPAYRTFIGAAPSMKFDANELAPNPVIYLGGALTSRSSAAGANIPRPTIIFDQPATVNVLAFDSTWGHSLTPGAPDYINPAAPWTNNFSNPPSASSQSENPANYVGWRNVSVPITDSEDAPGNRKLLARSAGLSRRIVDARAVVWQAHLWDNFIVGTYGVRKDKVRGWVTSRDTNSPSSSSFGQLNLGPTFKLPENDGGPISRISRAYTIVAHLSDLPGLSRVMEKLPVEISLFYNESTNFETLANRVDVYGEPIPLPEGETKDQGILIETRNRRASLKINKYETSATNANSGGLNGTWFLGASQAWFGNWANRFEFNWFGDTNAGLRAPAGDWELQTVNYGPRPGETQAQADAREAAAIAGWRAWQKSVDPRFYSAWQMNLNDPTKPITATNPNGFSLSEDSTSEGYEFELTAEPTRNLRVTLNAAKTTAVRKNIGGTNLADFVESYNNALRNTAAGDLRIWWGTADATALTEWNNAVGAEYAARKLQEGTSVPELREWRFNGIATYTFSDGRLKGLYAGGGVRWQDKNIIGYKPVVDTTTASGEISSVLFDLSNPYYGPTETNVDFWIGYSRRFSKYIDWQIQLNVRNVGEGDGLIPITSQWDGSPAGYRIAPPQTWTVTNTFRF
jgi:hypothetical protein